MVASPDILIFCLTCFKMAKIVIDVNEEVIARKKTSCLLSSGAGFESRHTFH